MATVSAILFDKDGTLFDFQATWGGWAAAVLADLSGGDAALAERLAEVLGFDTGAGRFQAHSVVIAETTETVAAALLPHIGGAVDRSGLVALLDRHAEQAPLEEAVPLAGYLANLRATGFRLGVVTNDSEAPARAHLGAAGVLDHFDFVAGYDSGHGAKPAPGPLLAAADAWGLEPWHVLMVGDSPHDLIAGRAAGMRTAGVLTGVATAADLAPLADVVLPDIGAVPGWIARDPG